MPNYQNIARQSALRYGLDPEIFVRQIGAESSWNPNAVSPAGARGIAQIMPATARGWGVNPDDPVAALDAAAKNMGRYVKSYKGDYAKALAAYNAGPGAVQQYGGVPPYKETQDYIKKILGGKTASNKNLTASNAMGANPASIMSGGGDKQSMALSLIFEDDPEMLGLIQQRAKQSAATPAASHDDHDHEPAPSIGNVNAGSGYKGLINLGKKFGLAIQGDFQTTGGKHSDGSYHYQGRAVDFGDANNTRKQLLQLAAYAKANPHLFKEFYYNPAGFGIKNGKVMPGYTLSGHDDHVHAAW